jgi:hypothetical protein
MEIAVHEYAALVAGLLDQLLRIIDGRVQEDVRAYPASVQVHSQQGTSLVTVDDAVHIEHGDNSKDKVLAELCRLI